MKIYQGILNRLGQSTISPRGNRYSLIEIGNKIVSRMLASERVASYLDVGKPLTLYTTSFAVMYRMILAVKQENGPTVKTSLFFLFINLLGLVLLYTFIFLVLMFFLPPALKSVLFLLLAGDWLWTASDGMRVVFTV